MSDLEDDKRKKNLGVVAATLEKITQESVLKPQVSGVTVAEYYKTNSNCEEKGARCDCKPYYPMSYEDPKNYQHRFSCAFSSHELVTDYVQKMALLKKFGYSLPKGPQERAEAMDFIREWPIYILKENDTLCHSTKLSEIIRDSCQGFKIKKDIWWTKYLVGQSKYQGGWFTYQTKYGGPDFGLSLFYRVQNQGIPLLFVPNYYQLQKKNPGKYFPGNIWPEKRYETHQFTGSHIVHGVESWKDKKYPEIIPKYYADELAERLVKLGFFGYISCDECEVFVTHTAMSKSLTQPPFKMEFTESVEKVRQQGLPTIYDCVIEYFIQDNNDPLVQYSGERGDVVLENVDHELIANIMKKKYPQEEKESDLEYGRRSLKKFYEEFNSYHPGVMLFSISDKVNQPLTADGFIDMANILTRDTFFKTHRANEIVRRKHLSKQTLLDDYDYQKAKKLSKYLSPPPADFSEPFDTAQVQQIYTAAIINFDLSKNSKTFAATSAQLIDEIHFMFDYYLTELVVSYEQIMIFLSGSNMAAWALALKIIQVIPELPDEFWTELCKTYILKYDSLDSEEKKLEFQTYVLNMIEYAPVQPSIANFITVDKKLTPWLIPRVISELPKWSVYTTEFAVITALNDQAPPTEIADRYRADMFDFEPPNLFFQALIHYVHYQTETPELNDLLDLIFTTTKRVPTIMFFHEHVNNRKSLLVKKLVHLVPTFYTSYEVLEYFRYCDLTTNDSYLELMVKIPADEEEEYRDIMKFFRRDFFIKGLPEGDEKFKMYIKQLKNEGKQAAIDAFKVVFENLPGLVTELTGEEMPEDEEKEPGINTAVWFFYQEHWDEAKRALKHKSKFHIQKFLHGKWMSLRQKEIDKYYDMEVEANAKKKHHDYDDSLSTSSEDSHGWL